MGHEAEDQQADHEAMAHAGDLYTCPMHPDFVTKDPDAKCPECGMKLKRMMGEMTYTCPMHPDFVTMDAGAKCPECGMKLVPKKGMPQTAPAH